MSNRKKIKVGKPTQKRPWLIPVNSNPLWKECFEEFKDNVIKDVRKMYDCFFMEGCEIVTIINTDHIDKNAIKDIVSNNLGQVMMNYIRKNCKLYYDTHFSGEEDNLKGVGEANVPFYENGIVYGFGLFSDGLCDILSQLDDDEKNLEKKVS